ncbi:RING-type domain-containing protein [Durusdinium trenchii]|uniref:RING-type domain-containing protein n=1 Tax=Durusdinium trenchii TaxID=1381693 RepID=A0ABP0IN03_9DINO
MIAKGLAEKSLTIRTQDSPVLEAKPKVLETCNICGDVTEAVRLIKTLPCNHKFHFDCIDQFHRQKLRERDMDLPCFTCGAASNKSIAAVMEDRRKERKEKEAMQDAAARPKESNTRPVRPKGSLSALAAALHEKSGVSSLSLYLLDL